MSFRVELNISSSFPRFERTISMLNALGNHLQANGTFKYHLSGPSRTSTTFTVFSINEEQLNLHTEKEIVDQRKKVRILFTKLLIEFLKRSDYSAAPICNKVQIEGQIGKFAVFLSQKQIETLLNDLGSFLTFEIVCTGEIDQKCLPLDLELRFSGEIVLLQLFHFLFFWISLFSGGIASKRTDLEVIEIIEDQLIWLKHHEQAFNVIQRFFRDSYQNNIASWALEDPDPRNNLDIVQRTEKRTALRFLRQYAIVDVLFRLDPQPVKIADLGCGKGKLTRAIIVNYPVQEMFAVDLSKKKVKRTKHCIQGLYKAHPRIHFIPINVFRGSIVNFLPYLSKVDTFVISEVIEHLPQVTLLPLFRLLLQKYSVQHILVTTPNKEYNIHYDLTPNNLRIEDHLFEFTRSEFNNWVQSVVDEFPDYSATISGIGNQVDEYTGYPTQMVVFSKKRFTEQNETTDE